MDSTNLNKLRNSLYLVSTLIFQGKGSSQQYCFNIMGKQKIVIKVQMEDAKKRTKALKAAVGLYGVISAEIDGEKILVVGDGIDSVALTIMMRKKMGFAELISVSNADNEKKKKEKEEKDEKTMYISPYQYTTAPQYIHHYRDPYYDPCRIM